MAFWVPVHDRGGIRSGLHLIIRLTISSLFFSFPLRPLFLPFAVWLSLGLSFFLGHFIGFGYITIKMNIGYSWITFARMFPV